MLPHGTESEASARYDGANEELVVDYHLSSQSAATVTAPDLFVLGPDNFHKALDLTRLSPGTWRGRVKIGSLAGLFRVRPLNDSRAFPEVGLYRQESELSDYGSNQALLQVDRRCDRRTVQSDGKAVARFGRKVYRFDPAAVAGASRLWRFC